MFARILAAAAILLLTSVPALAGKAPAPGSTVEMPYLMAPLTVDEKLVAYAYISPQIIAASPSAAIDIRLQTAFIQDAFVRDVNATSVGSSADPGKVERAALAARLLKDARRVMGQGKVAGVAIAQVQIARLTSAPAQ